MLFKRPAASEGVYTGHSLSNPVRVDGIEPILKEACSQVYPESAICVQRFDDSLNSAIRITYRISLRSSSLREPRYPLLRVVLMFVLTVDHPHI
jgi:protein tyrosine/serine phosphatase